MTNCVKKPTRSEVAVRLKSAARSTLDMKCDEKPNYRRPGEIIFWGFLAILPMFQQYSESFQIFWTTLGSPPEPLVALLWPSSLAPVSIRSPPSPAAWPWYPAPGFSPLLNCSTLCTVCLQPTRLPITHHPGTKGQHYDGNNVGHVALTAGFA